jgi:hypothetical protein
MIVNPTTYTAEQLADLHSELDKMDLPSLRELAGYSGTVAEYLAKRYLTTEAAEAAKEAAPAGPVAEAPASAEQPAPALPPRHVPASGGEVIKPAAPVEVKQFTPDQAAVFRTLDAAGRARMEKLLV